MNRNPLIPLCICHIMLYHGTSTSVMCICRQQHVNRSVLVEGKKYDKIQVVGDGQCFFRCLVAFGWQDIRCANRNEIGSPLDINIAVRETALAERLRTKTVEFLSMHKYDLNILCGKLPFLLDSKLGQSYSGIEDRLSSMISNSEYTGFLEMAAVSYITGHEIRVFHESKKQRTIELYTSLSSVNSSKSNSLLHIPVTLLYQVDDCRGAGHFMLLYPTDAVINQDKDESPIAVVLNENTNANTEHQYPCSPCVTFVEWIANHFSDFHDLNIQANSVKPTSASHQGKLVHFASQVYHISFICSLCRFTLYNRTDGFLYTVQYRRQRLVITDE